MKISFTETDLKALYIREVKAEGSKYKSYRTETLTEEKLSRLPEPVRKHYTRCGFAGKALNPTVQVEWGEVNMRLGVKKEWVKLNEVLQTNFGPEPARYVHLSAALGGFLPFEGRDKYSNGHGNMLIKAAKIFVVDDSKSKMMDESALVTILAEVPILPSLAFCDYIKWRGIDDTTAHAVMEHKGIKVEGVYHFNKDGFFESFETESRWYIDKEAHKMRWTAKAAEYFEKDGLLMPGFFSAVWHRPEGDFEYYRGKIKSYIYK